MVDNSKDDGENLYNTDLCYCYMKCMGQSSMQCEENYDPEWENNGRTQYWWEP